MGEEGWVELGRGGGKGLSESVGQEGLVLDKEGVGFGCSQGVQVAASVEGVNINHHAGVPVDSGPVVSKQFLGPSTEEVTGSVVVGNPLHRVAVTDPPEANAPDVAADDAEGPSASGDLSNKGMVGGLALGASAGGVKDRLEPSRGEGGVKGDG